MSHSEDIRERSLNYVSNGGKIKDAVKIFKISRSSFQRWRSSKIKTGSIENKPRVVEPYKINNYELLSYINEYPDAYIVEIAEHFSVTKGCISIALKRLNISRKKKAYYIQSAMKNKE